MWTLGGRPCFDCDATVVPIASFDGCDVALIKPFGWERWKWHPPEPERKDESMGDRLARLDRDELIRERIRQAR